MTKSNQLAPRIVIHLRKKDQQLGFYLLYRDTVTNTLNPIDDSKVWITLSPEYARVCSRWPDIITHDRYIEITYLFSEMSGGESLVRNYRHQKCRDGILRYQQIMLLLSQPKKP